MKGFLRKFFIVLITIIFIIVALLINYYTPSYKNVQISSQYNVRLANKDEVTNKQLLDTYIVITTDNKNKNRSYYNYNTNFSFPFYFKFNSTKVFSDIQRISDKKSFAEIKYYGWQISSFDIYPNIISVREINGFNSPNKWPILSWILYFITFIIWLFLINLIRKLFENK